MKNTKKAETLVAIMVVVVILSFAALGIFSILNFDKDISYNFSGNINKFLIQSNYENIIKKMSLENIDEKEKFYLYKNTSSGIYEIFTGSTNKKYSFIDNLGNLKDENNKNWKNFEIVFTKNFDIIRDKINPIKINNLVFHFDASKITGYSSGQTISTLNDLSGNSLNGTKIGNPIYQDKGIKQKPAIKFKGNDRFDIENNNLINTSSSGYTEKSFAIVFKTAFDTKNDQVIYEQGGSINGYNVYIKDGKLKVYVYNTAWASNPFIQSIFSFFGINISSYTFEAEVPVYPDSTYFIVIVHDSKYKEKENGDKNKLSIYINGKLVGEKNLIPKQDAHTGGIGLGGVNTDTRIGDTTVLWGNSKNFKGLIGEFISWNHALSPNEVKGVTNYLKEKWIGGTEEIKYENISVEVKKTN